MFVLRPLILIPAWSFYLIGAGDGHGSPLSLGEGLAGMPVLVCLSAILVSAYLINQVFDRESDELNDKCHYLSRDIFHARTLVALAVVFFVVASAAFQRTPVGQRLPLFLALVLSLLYSLPPLRLCARPFADLLSNAVGYGGVAYVLGFGLHGISSSQAVLRSLPYVLLVGATFLHTAILDVRGDRATGKITTAVFLGTDRTIHLAGALHALAVVAALGTGNTWGLAITIASFPATGYAFLARAPRASALLVQINTLIITVAAIVVWPAYLLVVVPLIALSRFYYKRRFGIIYPGPRRTA